MMLKHALIVALLAAAGGFTQAADPPVVDLAHAERIHMSSCFMCHGADGESSTRLFPRLAGQHYQYIVRQLESFQTGKRKSNMMESVVKELSHEDMVALGVFFENKPTSGNEVEDADLVAVGRFIYLRGNEFAGVPACAGCHGQDGHGAAQLPRLASQISRYIENQLKSFNQRERTSDNEVMHAVAANMTELEIRAVAAYVSSLD